MVGPLPGAAGVAGNTRRNLVRTAAPTLLARATLVRAGTTSAIFPELV